MWWCVAERNDYTSGPFEMEIPAGATIMSLPISITNDKIIENNETFFLSIIRFELPSEFYIGFPFHTAVTIVDDDGNWINSTSE